MNEANVLQGVVGVEMMGDISVKKAIRLAVDVLFAVAAAVLYFSFLSLDLSGAGDSTVIKYVAILMVFAYSLTNAFSVDGLVVAAALLFTVIADTFLLLINAHYLPGVLSFCVVQALYFVRMVRLGRYRRWWMSVIVRVFVWAAVVLGLGIVDMLDGLLCVTAFYFINLAVNMIESFGLRRKKRGMLFFFLGLALFVCCDLCVGIHNLSQYLSVDGLKGLCDFASIGMWTFYLPSQVLIAFSVRSFRRENHEA